MKKFCNTIPEEQETIINIDYSNKEVLVYTSQSSIYKRITDKIGQPTYVYYLSKQISGGKWIIPFKDKKRITQVLSRPILIGQRK